MSDRLLEVLEDFRDISKLVMCAEDPKGVVQPEDVFLLFLERCPDLADTEQTVEDTVIEYLDCLPPSKRTPINLVKCKVSPEELHLVSLSKIYPWSLIEGLKSLPALVRLDGGKSIYGAAIIDYKKLDLVFRKSRRLLFNNDPPHLPDIPARYAVLKVKPGDCSVHGKVTTPPQAPVVLRDVEYPEEVKPKIEVVKKMSSDANLCMTFHLIPVERRPMEEPVVEPPPPPVKQKKKKKKKGKGKKGKKKGKGKGKGKKRKK